MPHMNMKIGRLALVMMILAVPFLDEEVIQARGQESAKSAYVGPDHIVRLMTLDVSGKYQLTEDTLVKTENRGRLAGPIDHRGTTSSPGGPRIVFVSDRDGNEEIYVMNADGSGVTRLTHNPAYDGGPSWSPDGTRIAFDSERDGNYDIYVMKGDGTEVTRLTDDLEYDGDPSWSPDGTRIAFMSTRDGNAEIYVMDADGSRETNLTNNAADDAGFAWSPEGTRIAFVSNRDEPLGLWEIYVMKADGSGVTRLTRRSVSAPVWSPDGSRIAFMCDRDGSYEICVMNSDGSGQRNLTSNPHWDCAPSWSPDGSRIAFITGRDDHAPAHCEADHCKGEIYVMNADGSGVTRLTDNAAYDGHTRWSPDGSSIAFVSDRDANSEIYVMNADGSGQTNLTNNPAYDWGPSWGPNESGPVCGAWDGTTSDQRIRLTRISEASGDDCHGAFLFSNGTGIWGLGGYTLELKIQRSENASAVWMTLAEESPPLLPSLDLELHTFPVDRYSKAQISVEGSMTLGSVTGDTALFLLKTALAFVPTRACVVPDEQLAYAAVRVSHILAPVAQLALEGDLIGAKQELQQLLPEFFSRSSAALKEIGFDCGAEFLKNIIGQPAVIARLGVAYMTWVPMAIMDYFKYQGRPAYASLAYEVSPAAIPGQPQGHIALHSVCEGSLDIFVMKGDGSEVMNVTHSPDIGEHDPSWSSDGQWIAFERGPFPPVPELTEIYIMRADGSGLTRLTSNEVNDSGPSWSPDGQWIAFVSFRDSDYEIFKMRADGSEVMSLTSNDVDDWEPSWSPDGQWIAFESFRDFNSDIYKMRADGSQLTRLTQDEAYDGSPSWSPDGRRIAFSSRRDGNSGIYIVNADGSRPTRVTNSPGDELDPAWSPDGDWIAFTYGYWIPADPEGAYVTEIHAVRVADGQRIVLFSTCPDPCMLCDAWDAAWTRQ